MKKTLTLAALGLTLTFSSAAMAQDLEPDTTYEFGDDDVLGTGVGPDGTRILVPPAGRRVSLIRPRVHFVPEMLKSVETL